ncbi:MAG TPA: DUF4252 domain-containing protein [Petrimonas sp.]|uniref:DUF4252 domain-containing protein n=1 Tax=Petrimonas sp. TaxID=2023866 RepID=UPI0009697942|nr:DUF4252 domain-containing protein [Petrimonas sp.]OJV36524.1 MAG: hypothetical protein BGO33_12565 [Bacteroidia bacterium 43-41]MEA4949193.1 DUF4252 domain-containing protein [Petrimonas sp.]MEA4980234.1 DUF4252 domain-containing protein [Petrimonas sp.]MEA5045821.1 DUF4252 domain-containing protein [Petrimonas sp.]
MKKTILSILLLASFTFTFAQKNPFEQFSDMDGVTSVYISKTMLSLIPKNSKMDYGGVKVGGFLNKLTSILILTSEDKKIAPQMLSMANERVKGRDYELLMRVKSDDNDNINFFMKGKPEDIRELIMIVAGNDGENVVMQFLGNFTLQDIQQMTEGFNK